MFSTIELNQFWQLQNQETQLLYPTETSSGIVTNTSQDTTTMVTGTGTTGTTLIGTTTGGVGMIFIGTTILLLCLIARFADRKLNERDQIIQRLQELEVEEEKE